MKHELLNAKPENVGREAEIVAQAGREGAVTISTNMAGRGTDIILGGNPETLAWAQLKQLKNSDERPLYPTRLEVPDDVWKHTVTAIENKENMKAEGRKIAEKGGLHIVGTERHESRRIDNQLRGRAGRQGDPGSSRFYLSLEDELMRLFGGERMRRLMNNPLIGLKDGEAIESGMLSRQIEKAQKKVEEYPLRAAEEPARIRRGDGLPAEAHLWHPSTAVLDGANPRAMILDMIDGQIASAVERYTAESYGAASFAEFASNRLNVEFDASDFRGSGFEEAEQIARGRAIENVPTVIQEAMDENLSVEEDEKNWKWQALALAAQNRFGIKDGAGDLKKIGREALPEYLQKAADKMIGATVLADGARFLDRNYGREELAGWMKSKFGIEVNVGDLLGVEAADLTATLQSKVRGAYRTKDIAFPVQVGLIAHLPDKTIPGRRPNREALFTWSQHRFNGVELNEELFRTEPRSVVKEKLQEVSASLMPKADYPEIDEKLAEVFSGATLAEVADAGELVEWAKFGIEARSRTRETHRHDAESGPRFDPERLRFEIPPRDAQRRTAADPRPTRRRLEEPPADDGPPPQHCRPRRLRPGGSQNRLQARRHEALRRDVGRRARARRRTRLPRRGCE